MQNERESIWFANIEKLCLLGMILGMPFWNLSSRWHIPFGHNLSLSFLNIGLIVLIIWHFRTGEIKIPHKRFIFCMALWFLLCCTIGAITFPYYTPQVMEILQNSKFMANIIKVWPEAASYPYIACVGLYYSFVRQLFRDFLIPFFGMYIILYNLYGKGTMKKGIYFISNGVFALSLVMEVFSIFEIWWLWTKSPFCEKVLNLVMFNLYDIGSSFGWWPMPLVGRLRNFCAEPAFFGIIAIFMIPVLSIRIINGKKWELIPFTVFMTMFVAARSLTAVYIFLGVIGLFIVGLIIFRYPHWKRMMIATIGIVVLAYAINMIGMIGGQSLQNNSSEANAAKSASAITSYNNSLSITYHGPGARVVESVAAFQTGIHNPIFGVGRGYEAPFMEQLVPESLKSQPEYHNWMIVLDKRTFVKSSIPVLNQITRTFAWGGIPGLLFFLMPVLYSFYLCWKKRDWLRQDVGLLLLLVMVCGELVCQVGNTMIVVFPYGTAILLLCLEAKEKTDLIILKDDNKTRAGRFWEI